MSQPILTTPITTNSNLEQQTPPLETTPLLQHTWSTYSDILGERGDTQFITRRTPSSTPAPPVVSGSSTEPPDESSDTDSGQPLVRDKTWRDSKLDLASHVRAVSLTLENSGSVARDHLASERTFLAYVRTSLSIASAGVGTPTYSPLLTVVADSHAYSTGPDFEFHRKILTRGGEGVEICRIVRSSSGWDSCNTIDGRTRNG